MEVQMDIQERNDSLYQFYKPEGRASLQVVFFHGFQANGYEDAHVSTWKSGDGSCIWPQTWLVKEYPKAQILSVSYNGALRKSRGSGQVDMNIMGENLMWDMLQADIGQERHCPVVLVGHSFGGLIIKQVCLQAQKKSGTSVEHKNFLKNVKGMLFYATPHHGIAFENLPGDFMNQDPLLEYVRTLSTPAARLNDDFENLRREHKAWRVAGAGEDCKIKLGLFKEVLVVPEASARYGEFFRIITDSDHMTICRPMKKTSATFQILTSLLKEVHTASKRDQFPENIQNLPKQIVGIGNVMEEVKDRISEVTCLGLTGMGGIGKTTLVKALFNDIACKFEYTCFVKQVKDIKGSDQGVDQAVLNCMHHLGKPVEGEVGFNFLRGKEVLLVLDDVDKPEHLMIVENLQNTFAVCKDSRFVATSRDSQLLKQCCFTVYAVHRLSMESSGRLFRNYAFREDVVPSLYKQYVARILRKCKGLPLTLEVIGKHLYGKSEVEWEETIQALHKAELKFGKLEEQLWNKLKVSYDALHDAEKEMFLDATTLFYIYSIDGAPVRGDLTYAKAVWSTTIEYPESSWKALRDLSLVEEESGQYYHIHDQLVSLGRMIASTEHGFRSWECAEGKDDQNAVALKLSRRIGCRIWSCTGSTDGDYAVALELLTRRNCAEKDFKDVVALKFWPDETEEGRKLRRIQGSTLSNMHKLRYLSLSNVIFSEIDGGIHFPFLSRGQVVKLPSTLLWLWLFSVDLTGFVLIPKNHKRLVVLLLDCVWGIRTLPATFGQLSSLQVLDLQEIDLESLPSSLGELKRLKVLRIWYCVLLKKLPETVNNLESLETLELVYCQALSLLPESVGDLPNLKKFDIKGCSCLYKRPKSVLKLKNLEILRLEDSHLQSIPDLDKLVSLTSLLLGWAPEEGLPDMHRIRRASSAIRKPPHPPKFPSLPKFLGEEITESNYKKGRFDFRKEDGTFTLRGFYKYNFTDTGASTQTSDGYDGLRNDFVWAMSFWMYVAVARRELKLCTGVHLAEEYDKWGFYVEGTTAVFLIGKLIGRAVLVRSRPRDLRDWEKYHVASTQTSDGHDMRYGMSWGYSEVVRLFILCVPFARRVLKLFTGVDLASEGYVEWVHCVEVFFAGPLIYEIGMAVLMLFMARKARRQSHARVL